MCEVVYHARDEEDRNGLCENVQCLTRKHVHLCS